MQIRIGLIALSLAAAGCGNTGAERAAADRGDNGATAPVAPANMAQAPRTASTPIDPRITAASLARYDRASVPAEITTVDETKGVTCAAYLARQIESMAPAERAPLVAAMRAWRGEADRAMGREPAAQFFASAAAILRESPAAEVQAGAGYCLSRAPRNR
jgi:hypothetical protein